jgi:type IV secretion system protein VirB1
MAFVEFAMVAALCAPHVHPVTLSSVVMQESRGAVYAIGVNGDYKLLRQPQSLEEAIETAEWLRAEGYDFDAGLGQINSRNFDRLGLSIPDLFNPCKNLRAAATVLTECYTRSADRFGEGQVALQAALSCYNTGDFRRGITNGYVQKVTAHVTVTVPALQPLAGAAPVQKNLQSPVRHVPKRPAKQTAKDELHDAFSDAEGDAFAKRQPEFSAN